MAKRSLAVFFAFLISASALPVWAENSSAPNDAALAGEIESAVKAGDASLADLRQGRYSQQDHETLSGGLKKLSALLPSVRSHPAFSEETEFLRNLEVLLQGAIDQERAFPVGRPAAPKEAAALIRRVKAPLDSFSGDVLSRLRSSAAGNRFSETSRALSAGAESFNAAVQGGNAQEKLGTIYREPGRRSPDAVAVPAPGSHWPGPARPANQPAPRVGRAEPAGPPNFLGERSRAVSGLPAGAESALAAATGLALPGNLRERAKFNTYDLKRRRLAEDRAGKTRELLMELLEGPGLSVERKNSGFKLADRYADLLAVRDPGRRFARLGEWQRDADSFLEGSGAPLLRQEQELARGRTDAVLSASGAMARFGAEVRRAHPELSDAVAEMIQDPGKLKPGQAAALQRVLPKHYGGRAYRDFAAGRGSVKAADQKLRDFYAAHPALKAYQEQGQRLQKFNWANVMDGRVADKTEFSPAELGIKSLPPATVLIKDTVDGRGGFWTAQLGAGRFQSLDGRFTVERKRDEAGAPIEVKVWRGRPGEPAAAEIRSLDPHSPWKTQKGIVDASGFHPSATGLQSGAALRKLDAVVTEILDQDGKRLGLQVDTQGLEGAQSKDRENAAREVAQALVQAGVWPKASFDRVLPLAQWLRDSFSFKRPGAQGSRLVVEKDGSLQLLTRFSDGGRRIETARFGPSTSWQGRDMGQALVLLAPSSVSKDGTTQGSPTRWKEYLSDGTLLEWREKTEAPVESRMPWRGLRSETQIALRRLKRGADGKWMEMASEVRQTLGREIPGTSKFGMMGAALSEVPVFGSIARGLGKVGDVGLNFAVGANQSMIGALFDNAAYRVEGRAGLERMMGDSPESVARRVEEDMTPDERAIINQRAYEVRARELKAQGLTPDRFADRNAYEKAIYGPVTDETRADVLLGHMGAGTYGAKLGEMAAETSGWQAYGLGTASVLMHAGEGTARSLPTLIVLGELGGGAATRIGVEASSLDVAAVTTARVANASLQPYFMAGWGLAIPEGMDRLYEGVKAGDAAQIAESMAQVGQDAVFVTMSAKDFARGVEGWRAARKIERVNRLLSAEPGGAGEAARPVLPAKPAPAAELLRSIERSEILPKDIKAKALAGADPENLKWVAEVDRQASAQADEMLSRFRQFGLRREQINAYFQFMLGGYPLKGYHQALHPLEVNARKLAALGNKKGPVTWTDYLNSLAHVAHDSVGEVRLGVEGEITSPPAVGETLGLLDKPRSQELLKGMGLKAEDVSVLKLLIKHTYFSDIPAEREAATARWNQEVSEYAKTQPDPEAAKARVFKAAKELAFNDKVATYSGGDLGTVLERLEGLAKEQGKSLIDLYAGNAFFLEKILASEKGFDQHMDALGGDHRANYDRVLGMTKRFEGIKDFVKDRENWSDEKGRARTGEQVVEKFFKDRRVPEFFRENGISDSWLGKLQKEMGRELVEPRQWADSADIARQFNEYLSLALKEGIAKSPAEALDLFFESRNFGGDAKLKAERKAALAEAMMRGQLQEFEAHVQVRESRLKEFRHDVGNILTVPGPYLALLAEQGGPHAREYARLHEETRSFNDHINELIGTAKIEGEKKARSVGAAAAPESAARLQERVSRLQEERLLADAHFEDIARRLEKISGEFKRLPRPEGTLERQWFDNAGHNIEYIDLAVADYRSLVPEAGTKLKLEPTDLGPIARKVVTLMEKRAADKEIKISLILPKTPSRVLAHQAATSRVLWNLIENAIKYTPEGGKITVSIAEEGGRARVLIEDSGIGLAQEDIRAILSGKAHRTEAGKAMANGHGIGLGTLVRGLVEAQGGRLTIESPGKNLGSRFSFELGAKEPAVPPAPKTKPAVVAGKAAGVGGFDHFEQANAEHWSQYGEGAPDSPYQRLTFFREVYLKENPQLSDTVYQRRRADVVVEGLEGPYVKQALAYFKKVPRALNETNPFVRDRLYTKYCQEVFGKNWEKNDSPERRAQFGAEDPIRGVLQDFVRDVNGHPELFRNADGSRRGGVSAGEVREFLYDKLGSQDLRDMFAGADGDSRRARKYLEEVYLYKNESGKRIGINEELAASLRPGIYYEVKAVDAKGKQGDTKAEFDVVDLSDPRRGVIIEKTSLEGLGTLNPKTGKPAQTVEQWAQKKIWGKTVMHIDNLKKAVRTRPTEAGAAVPTLTQLRAIRRLVFKIEAPSTPEIERAVNAQLLRLRAEFPDWEFSVAYGKR